VFQCGSLLMLLLLSSAVFAAAGASTAITSVFADLALGNHLLLGFVVSLPLLTGAPFARPTGWRGPIGEHPLDWPAGGRAAPAWVDDRRALARLAGFDRN